MTLCRSEAMRGAKCSSCYGQNQLCQAALQNTASAYPYIRAAFCQMANGKSCPKTQMSLGVVSSTLRCEEECEYLETCLAMMLPFESWRTAAVALPDFASFYG